MSGCAAITVDFRKSYRRRSSMKILSRADAIASGSKHYFTGKPCPNGHVAPRYVSTFACKVCLRDHVREQQKKPDYQAKRRAYKESHRSMIQARRRAYDAANRESINQRAYQWAEANRDKVIATWQASNRRRRLDPQFVLAKRMSDRVRHALKLGRTRKGVRSWESIVGYSLAELAASIEKQFLPGMSWANIGEWHIDHIVPIVAFRFTSETDSDFKACWSIGNLRPLWARQNKSKGAKPLFLL